MKLSCDSEVYFVSEVSPDGEVANLTSLWTLVQNFTIWKASKSFTDSKGLLCKGQKAFPLRGRGTACGGWGGNEYNE